MNQKLKVDALHDAALALEFTKDQLEKVKTDPRYWKWALLGTYDALHGFMEGALGEGRVQSTSADADSLLALYERIKSDEMRHQRSSRVFAPAPGQDESIKRISDLRKTLVYTPTRAWSLEPTELTRVITDGIKVVNFLIFDSGNVHLDRRLSTRLRALNAGLLQTLVTL